MIAAWEVKGVVVDQSHAAHGGHAGDSITGGDHAG
jgi:hypothetical protein